MILAWLKGPSGKSLSFERRTTKLPEDLEGIEHMVTALVLGDYYRTYPGGYTAGLVQEVHSLSGFYYPPDLSTVSEDDREVCVRAIQPYGVLCACLCVCRSGCDTYFRSMAW